MEVLERKELAAPSAAPKGAAALYHVWDRRGPSRFGSCLLVLSCAVALQPCPALPSSGDVASCSYSAGPDR